MDTTIPATVVSGHQVASGMNGDPRFPGGTIRMQAPHFLARGLDLSGYHTATLNVGIDPYRYQVISSQYTFRGVQWHPTEPAEDFSFFDVLVLLPGREPVAGLIYHPHPATKPEHFQKPDVLELLLPWIEGLGYGMSLSLVVPAEQMRFEL